MNEELQKQIANMLQAALAAAQKGGEWLAGQIPEVLHQLIVWTVVKGLLGFGLWLAIWVVVGSYITSFWKKASKFQDFLEAWKPIDPASYYYSNTDRLKSEVAEYFNIAYIPWIYVFGGLGVCNFVYTFFMWGNLFDAVQAWVAPKLFLLEYVSHMVKG